MTFGPTFVSELVAAGVAGLPFSWEADGTIIDQGLTPEQLAAVEAVVAAHDPKKQLPAVITFEQFMGLFTVPEQTVILDSSDLGVRLWLLKGTAASQIDLGNPEVAQSLDYLISKGLLTTARKTMILANTP
jgi:hypothetical protein